MSLGARKPKDDKNQRW